MAAESSELFHRSPCCYHRDNNPETLQEIDLEKRQRTFCCTASSPHLSTDSRHTSCWDILWWVGFGCLWASPSSPFCSPSIQSGLDHFVDHLNLDPERMPLCNFFWGGAQANHLDHLQTSASGAETRVTCGLYSIIQFIDLVRVPAEIAEMRAYFYLTPHA